ncbi:hypothetical protein MARINOS108_20158 [Marinoscillum sp. 108]|nr:hypothetical protein MARINOS108_20158 [Marinoscillum sp. 108]
MIRKRFITVVIRIYLNNLHLEKEQTTLTQTANSICHLADNLSYLRRQKGRICIKIERLNTIIPRGY